MLAPICVVTWHSQHGNGQYIFDGGGGVLTHEDKVAALQDKAGIDVVHPSRQYLGGEVWWCRSRHDWVCRAAASIRVCHYLSAL